MQIHNFSHLFNENPSMILDHPSNNFHCISHEMWKCFFWSWLVPSAAKLYHISFPKHAIFTGQNHRWHDNLKCFFGHGLYYDCCGYCWQWKNCGDCWIFGVATSCQNHSQRYGSQQACWNLTFNFPFDSCWGPLAEDSCWGLLATAHSHSSQLTTEDSCWGFLAEESCWGLLATAHCPQCPQNPQYRGSGFRVFLLGILSFWL